MLVHLSKYDAKFIVAKKKKISQCCSLKALKWTSPSKEEKVEETNQRDQFIRAGTV